MGAEGLVVKAGWWLGLYPAGWRRRYRSEVEAVLESHRVTARTVVDLLLGMADAWLDPAFRAGRRSTMKRLDVLAGLSLFFVVGVLVVLIDALAILAPLGGLTYLRGLDLNSLFLTGLCLPALGFGLAWVKGFPRWAYPYVALALVLTLVWASSTSPGLTVLGYTFGHYELWGWRAWIPLLAAAGIALLVTRSSRQIRQLFEDIWQDWTRASFALYGILPLYVWIGFDEIEPSYRLPYVALMNGLLVAGAIGYLLTVRNWRRALALAAGTASAMLTMFVCNSLYWSQHREPWMEAFPPQDGSQQLLRTVGITAICVAVILLPGLLGLAKHLLDSRRGAPRLASSV